MRPAYFRGEVLNRDTPTRVPDEIGTPVGLFGIEPFDEASGAEGARGPSPGRHRGSPPSVLLLRDPGPIRVR